MPTYFRSLGIRVTGSTFSPEAAARHEVIVNRGFVARYWPGQSGVGRRFRFIEAKNQKPDEGWMTVIGVADDVPTRGLAGDRGEPFVYQPMNPKEMNSRVVLAVRAKDGIDPTAALRKMVTSFDARLVPPPVITVDADLASSISTQRFTMTLLAAFAALAVVLSAVGLYGVISYVVTQRTREIGIRVALGATPRQVARAIVLRGLVLSVGGLVVGLVAAVWGTRLIKAALYQVTSTDPASYALAGLTLLAVSVLACLVPMRRAMRVDPLIAMRGE
jgi:putative ABC transport system permease protein